MRGRLSGLFGQTERAQIIVLGLVYFVTRLPLIFSGFGYRPDAWTTGASGWYSALAGHYVYSRPPGYPLAEGIVAIAPPGQYWMANLIAVLFGFGSVLLFFHLKNFGLLGKPFWSTLILIFTPTFWIVSTETLDSAFALFWLLASYHALLNSNYKLSAVFLGMACGFRPSSGVMLLPALVFLVAARSNWKKLIEYLVVFGITGLIVFSPVLVQYGINVLPGFKLRFWMLQVGYSGVQVFGVIGTLAILIAMLFAGIRKYSSIQSRDLARARDWLTRPAMVYAVCTIAVITVLFVRVPDHSEYFLPAVPFILILLDRLLRQSMVALPALALLMSLSALLSPQVWKLDPLLGVSWTNHLVLAPGTVIQEELDRRRQIEFARAVLSAHIPCDSVVMAGWSLPSIEYLRRLEGDTRCPEDSPIQYVPLLDPNEVRRVVGDGRRVYWVGRTLRHASYAFEQTENDFADAIYLDVGIAP